MNFGYGEPLLAVRWELTITGVDCTIHLSRDLEFPYFWRPYV